VAAVAAVAALAAVAQSATAATHKSFKGTVKVGVVADITGDLSVASDMQAALAYFDKVNASGGVDGYKIVPTEYDTQSSPSTAVQAFRRAIAAKPAAIVGSSDVAGSALPTLAQSGIPSVGDGFAPGWTGHKNLFPIEGDQVGHYSNVMLVVQKLYGHATKIAVLGGTVGLPDAKNIIAQAPKTGVQLVMQDLETPLVPTSAQFLTLAEQIKASGAQGVVGLGVEGQSQLQVDLNQLGAQTTVIATDLGPATTSENGLLYSNSWAEPFVKNDPGINAYIAAMKKYGYGKLVFSSAYGPIKWAMAALLVQGLKKAGPPFSRNAVVKALGETKNFTADGVVPDASFPAFQKVGTSCQVVLKVVNGQWVSEKNNAYPFVCGGPSLMNPS
jgi:ABC-type branched-subunit amino acid transport system substrate-binding protein